MRCDMCQEREATVHNTFIVGEVVKHSNLCEGCFEATKPTEARDLATALQAGCRYCGGEPYSGGGYSLAGSSGGRSMSFMCKPCAEEYYRFLREKWPSLGDVAITDEQIAAIHRTDAAAVFREAEEHMRTWVAERKSK